MPSLIQKITTSHAPAAIGPYSQAILVENFLFVSGQLPLHPKTGKIVDFTIEGQTEQVLNNIEAILKEADLTWESVVKTEVYLKDLNDFHVMNILYEKRVSHSIKPARQALQVARLPLDALLEISCIAHRAKK